MSDITGLFRRMRLTAEISSLMRVELGSGIPANHRPGDARRLVHRVPTLATACAHARATPSHDGEVIRTRQCHEHGPSKPPIGCSPLLPSSATSRHRTHRPAGRHMIPFTKETVPRGEGTSGPARSLCATRGTDYQCFFVKPRGLKIGYMSSLTTRTPQELRDATPDEYVAFVQMLWDEIAQNPDSVPVPDEHRAVLDERLRAHQENRDPGEPRGVVRDRILADLRSR